MKLLGVKNIGKQLTRRSYKMCRSTFFVFFDFFWGGDRLHQGGAGIYGKL